MKNAVTFTTAKRNLYLYSPFRNQFLLCHPLIRHFFLLEKTGVHFPDYIKKIQTEGGLELKPFGSFSPAEVRYQLSKFRFLKKKGFFRPVKHHNLSGILAPNRIDENISNLQQIIFETTEECNLSCTYCTYSKYYINKERHKKTFNLPDAQRTLDLIISKRNLKKNPELTVSFYGGEPLKNITFIKEIVAYLESYPEPKPVFKFTMSSNGLLLAKYLDFLVEHSIELAVSLDGDEWGNSFRVTKNHKPSFDRIIQNLGEVKKKYPDYFDKKISFLTVLHSRNSHDSVYRFFHNKFNKITTTSTITTFHLNEKHRDEFVSTFLTKTTRNKSEFQLMQKMFLRHPNVKEMADTLEKYSGYIFKSRVHLLAGKPQKNQRKNFIPTGTCLPFALRVFLTAEGVILPCEHISRIFEIGHVKNEKITIDPDAIALKYNQYYSKIRPLCEQCYLENNCQECVFNTKIETNRPECEFFTDEANFIRRLSKNISLVEKDYPFYLRLLKEAFHE